MPIATRQVQFDVDERRVEERAPIGHPSTIRVAGGPATEVIVEDLSRLGFRYRSVNRLDVGATVQVGLAGSGVAQATVVRRDGELHGCVFTQPLSQASLATAFSNGTVHLGNFGTTEPLPWAVPAASKLPRRARALIWLVGGGVPWLLLAAVRFG